MKNTFHEISNLSSYRKGVQHLDKAAPEPYLPKLQNKS